MRRLRDPVSGCEWDTVQTFDTIAPYTIEEAYEVADAIARNDMDALADELGDLQLQVVFHAQMAEEAGLFTLDDVLDGICDKMERRHPHIFGDAEHGGHHLWEKIKADERAAKSGQERAWPVSHLRFPALERAAKLQRRAARVGFDWPDASGPRAKIDEELAELDAETRTRAQARGTRRPAVRRREPRTTSQHRAGSRSARCQSQVRTALSRDREGARLSPTLSLDEKEALWAAAKKAQADSIA